jgi:hypothetical protein
MPHWVGESCAGILPFNARNPRVMPLSAISLASRLRGLNENDHERTSTPRIPGNDGRRGDLFRLQAWPITYRSSPLPFPNQRFARTVFFVVGVILIVGGLWSLWLTRHVGP